MPRTAHKTRQKRKRKREVKQAGGSDESVFTAQRCSPWLSRHSHGDSNVTGGDVAADALERKAIAAIVNVARIIAFPHITFGVAVWRAKEAECGRVESNRPVRREQTT